MMKDGKMSKSKGNVVSPFPLIDRYGVDALRYYFAREIIFGQDGQFTPEQFIERINMDLANNYGNLVSRTLSMIIKYFDGIIPPYVENINSNDKELEDLAKQTKISFEQKMDDLHISEAYMDVMNLLSLANKYIEDNAPWALSKDSSKLNNLKSVMAHLAYVISITSMMLKPVLVTKADKVFDYLSLSDEERDYNRIFDTNLLANKKVSKGEVLFPRLNNDDVEFVKGLMINNKK